MDLQNELQSAVQRKKLTNQKSLMLRKKARQNRAFKQ